MKNPVMLLCAAALLAGGCQTTSMTANVPPENITVTFDQPDKFTDLRERFGDSASETYMDILRRHVQETAGRYLAAGQKLEVTFTDVDLAGDFLPGRISTEDIRIVKDIYMPRMTLSFRQLDAQGAVLKSGERQLRNMNFMTDIGPSMRNEPLNYDRELLTRWLKDEFKG
jgi:hypothetical protein